MDMKAKGVDLTHKVEKEENPEDTRHDETNKYTVIDHDVKW
jgi:hypothetical protein